MTKRRTRWVRILLGSCVAAFLLLLLFPRTGSILLALIRGESFYEGLPTSYWSGVLKEWIHNGGRSQRARGLGRLFYQLDSLVLPDRLHIGHHGLLNLYLPEDDDVATALLIEIQPVLLQLLEDENAEVRRTTADFLGEIRTKIDPSRATPVVHALVAATRDSDIGVRQTAVGALGRLRLDGPVSVPRLIECLKDVQLRWHAAFALGEFGPDANSAVPALVEVLKDTNFTMRRIAAHSLGEIGTGAKAAVPELLNALKDRSDVQNNGTPLHQMAAKALTKIDPEAGFRARIP